MAIGPETVYGLIGDYLADGDLFARLQGQVLHVSAEVMETIVDRAAVDDVFLPLVQSA